MAKFNKKDFIIRLKEHSIREDIVQAFNNIDQAIFFDNIFKDKYYGDEVIPVGSGIKSDNFLMLAKMINYLDIKEDDRVLEIGTGSGYSTAILSALCREVITIEHKEKLAKQAKDRLYAYEFENIRFFAGDATKFASDYGNVDAVIVHCACYKRPLTLMQNLKIGGKMVFPMGPPHRQQIVIIQNEPDPNTGANLKMFFREQGNFEYIDGIYGYDSSEIPDDLGVIDEDVDLKPTIQSDDELEELESKVRSEIDASFEE